MSNYESVAPFPNLNPAAIDSHFPMPSYREGQRDAIEFAVNAFNSGKTIVILECPTGSGKSPIGMTMADMVPSSYYLTITKILQDQLTKDFGKRIVDLKGRNAYPCTYYKRFGQKLVDRKVWTQAQLDEQTKKDPTCANGYCRTTQNRKSSQGKAFKCDQCFLVAGVNKAVSGGDQHSLPPGMKYSFCPYYEQVYKAIDARKVVMNFSSFLYQTQMTKRFDNPRNLMIIDECHNIEPQLLNFVSFTINDIHLSKNGIFIPQLDHALEYALWMQDAKIHDLIWEVIKEARENDDTRLEDELARVLKKYKMFMDHVKQEGSEWVCEYEDKGTHRSVTLKPVFVQRFAHQLLFKYSQRVLMMSATVLDVNVMCRSLGIKREHVAAYRLMNRFPKKNRPIIIRSVAKMTGGKSKMAQWAPQLVAGVNKIVKLYPDKKGIIHTHNFVIMDHLIKRCATEVKKRFIHQREFNNDKRALLDEHARRPDSVIIAPAMHEGIDLADDLCYDQETEILTEFGWVLFPDLMEGTKVAAYHNTGQITFEQPSQITKTRADSWAEFNTMTNNLVVTQAHKMLWRNSQTGNFRELIASEAPAGKNWQFVTAGCYNNSGLNLSDDQLRLVVAFQADGSWLSTTDTSIRFSFRRQRKIERFREIITRLQYNIAEQTTKRGDTKFLVPKKYFVPLRILGEWDDTKLWKMEGLLKLSLPQRKILLDELKYWDGSYTNKGTTYDKMVYHSSIPENIDTIQAVAAISGYRTDYNGHCLTYRDKLFSTFVNGEHNYILKQYDTTLPCYCVTVSTGWIIIRRRGKVTVSGNSRFQIICKVPYANCFDDEQLARRVEIDRPYYTWLTALKLVQSYGRSVRSDTDYADTFILDEAIYKFMRDADRMLPGWFKEAIHDEGCE